MDIGQRIRGEFVRESVLKQRRIGLTGGIATGKSRVGHLLEQRGLPLLDADGYGREALAPGSPGERAVQERYGDGVRAPSGAIDRAATDAGFFSNAV